MTNKFSTNNNFEDKQYKKKFKDAKKNFRSFRKDFINIMRVSKIFKAASTKANEASSKFSSKKVSTTTSSTTRKEKEINLVTSL